MRKPFSPRDFTPELEHLLGGAGRQRLSHLIQEVVAQRGDQVEVTFDRPSRIGNFGRMVVRLDLGAIQEIQGSHPTAGVLRVQGMDDEATLLRVAGTNAEKRILDLQTKGRGARAMATLDILWLFSLDPAALRDALLAGRKAVTRPIQVIPLGSRGITAAPEWRTGSNRGVPSMTPRGGPR